MAKRLSWFESGKSLDYISHELQKAQEKIRIATGFFTIKGWNLVRHHTKGKQVDLLVGLDEPGEERARLALIQEIIRYLRTGLDIDRRQTVYDLIKKIQSNKFNIVDARATDHHNKLYIFDEISAIQASSNLTGKGLEKQVEGGSVITDKKEVIALIEDFDNYFLSAVDLTQELLESLLKWLEFSTPWDIYLKTMLAFEDIQPPKTRYTKQPVSYQVDMISQTLRHIRDFHGSMIVASTGLGKTVVAVHVALHLREEGLIDNVMIIGPKAVENNWKKEMREAGLYCEFFVQKIFDKPDKKAHRLEDFKEITEEAQQQPWLIIIDESHEFRNRFKQDLYNMKKNAQERIAFTRIRNLVKTGNVKVLLLTGSPYAKEIDNINNQLYLLPHSAERKPSDYDYFVSRLPEWEDSFIKDPNAWTIESVDKFVNLQVASQLTTPHVAKYYGKQDEQGIYINFGQEKRYIPNVTLHTISFPLIFEAEMTEAMTQGYYDINSKNPILRDHFKRLFKISWASSPLALQTVLERIIDTPGGKNSYDFNKYEFKYSRQQREEILKPTITILSEFNYQNDLKFMALSNILGKALEKQKKVIIFSERRPTVVYLYQAITAKFPNSRIARTIEESENEEIWNKKFNMKDSKEIENLIKEFAPNANQQKHQNVENYDIFISTDAHGVGVNMQDAAIVINYDIDWTPINPVQRAGRILRFWHSPRTIEIYTFVPTLTNEYSASQINHDLVEIKKRWNNLIDRHHESEKIIDLPVLTTEKTQKLNIPEQASQVTIESGEIDINKLANIEISPYYQHTAKLQINRDYAKKLSNDLMSCKLFPEKQALLYLLLLYHNNYHGIFYNPATQEFNQPDIVTILNKIACDENTAPAHVNYDEVERLSHACLKQWCEHNKTSPDDVERICSLYLKPESEDDTLRDILSN